MNRFIGLERHSSSCTFAVLSEKGKTIRTDVVETNGPKDLGRHPGRFVSSPVT
jgi:hypothetical protein